MKKNKPIKFKADPITDHDRLVYKMAYAIGYSEAQAKYQRQLELVEQKLRTSIVIPKKATKRRLYISD